MREQREMCEWVSGEKNQCVLCVVIDTDDVMAVFTISHIPSSTARISSSTATVAVVLPGFVRVVASTAISSVCSTATIAKTWRCGLDVTRGMVIVLARVVTVSRAVVRSASFALPTAHSM